MQTIQERIRQRRERLAALDQERAVLMAEIAAYEDALRLVGGSAEPQARGRASPSRTPETPRSRRQRDAAGRGISPHWHGILARMAARHPEPTSIAQIVSLAREVGYELSKPSARSQMSLYTAQALTERVGEGLFRVTPSAAERFDLTFPAEGDPGSGPPRSPAQGPDPGGPPAPAEAVVSDLRKASP